MGREYEKRRVWEGVIENYTKICAGKKALLFAASVQSSQEICAHLQAVGLSARHLDATFSKESRADVISWFRKTQGAILCNIGILTTGFDATEIECIILYRATTSIPLFLQMVGRGARKHAGKESFFVLDFGENAQRLGRWDDRREWSLTKKRKQAGVAPVKSCPKCKAINPASAEKCEYCGHEFKSAQEKAQEKKYAELIELPPSARMDTLRKEGLEELAKAAREKLINPIAVFYRLKTMAEAEEFANLMGYKKGFLFTNRARFAHLK
jgi:superfamily II DNA or RNA helicase